MKAALSIFLFFQIPAPTQKPGALAQAITASVNRSTEFKSTHCAEQKKVGIRFLAVADSGK